MDKQNKKIFISIGMAMGDHLASTPMLRNMRQEHPYAKIVVSALYPQLLYANPNIDDLYPLSPEFSNYVRNPYKFGFENSYTGRLSEAWCRVWDVPFDDDRLEYYITKAEDDEAQKYIKRFQKPIIIVAPFGGGALKDGNHIQVTQNKDWLIRNWEELCHRLKAKYTIIQIGAKAEAPLYNVDERLLDNPIRQTIALIPYCKLWISVDSFLQHIGSALDKKGIVLFGKTKPSIFGHANNVNVYKKACPLEKCHVNSEPRSQWNIDVMQCNDRKCMKAITVKEILNIVNHWDNPKYISKIADKYNKEESKNMLTMPTKNKGRIEVEIPTCDRHGYLAVLLANLRYQTFQKFDLTIIDDGKDESLPQNPQIMDLLKVLEADGHRWRMWRGVRKGPPIAHQKALEGTKHDYLLIIGDDCIIPPDYIEQLYNVVIRNKKIAAVGGICLHLPMLIDKKPYTKQQIKEGITGNPFEFNPLQWQKHPDKRLKSVCHLYGGFICRAEAVRAVGGFPQYLSQCGHREETDTTVRLWLAGYKLYINPNAIFFHHRAWSGGIRNFHKKENFEHDEREFFKRLEQYKKQYNYKGKK